MSFAVDNLEVLPEEECRSLLESVKVGRVAVTIGALPAIFPVNFGIVEGDIVFRTAEGTKLRAALDRAIVAFEVDGIDEVNETGWSVLVIGHASRIRNAADLERAEALELRPWAAGPHDHFVRVTTGMISGRRVRANGAPPSD